MMLLTTAALSLTAAAAGRGGRGRHAPRTSAFPPPPPPPPLPPGETEVLIIGGGWSGMSAAHTLAKAGVSFKVLEARQYTGGRTHAIQFGDSSVGKFTMEIGSGWLESSGKSGGPEKAPPPVSALADQCGLKTVFVPGSTQNMSNYRHVLTPDGKEGDADGSIRRAANAAYECIGKAASGKSGKRTVRAALTSCGWEPKTAVERAVDWALTVDDPGMLAEEQQLDLTLPDPVYEWWGPDDRFIIDQSPRGYARVLDEMVKDTVPAGDRRVVFGAKVAQVSYSTGGVTAVTTDGASYNASVAIATFPLGVLNREHQSLFSPSVPKKLAKILDSGNFIMSNLTRIYLQFPSVFWDNNAEAWLAASDGAFGEFPEFRNMNHASRVPGSNILLLFVGNPESIKYEGMSDAAVQAAVMTKLRQLYPQQQVPDPVAFHITRWGLDPLAYGCYSALKPGFDDDDYETITTPLTAGGQSRVYLGGEAMCDDLSGSTYGAYQSGRQIAETYLYSTGRQSKKPKDICWY